MPIPPSTRPQTQVVNQMSRGRPADDVGDEERHGTEQPQHRADPTTVCTSVKRAGSGGGGSGTASG